MHPLEALLSSRNGEPDAPRPVHEAQIERLREAGGRFVSPVPFVAGDLVTPRKDSPIMNKGEPHLVIDVNRDAPCDFLSAEPGDWNYGSRPQIRVLVVSRDAIVPFWNEAAHYERYVEGGA